MAGRETRAKRLLPSFIAVAGLMACGQFEDGPEVSVNPPFPDGSQAGNGNSGGRDSLGGTGGTGQVVVGGTAGSSGAAGSWGGNLNPPCIMSVCPANLPEPGSSCNPAVGPFGYCYGPLSCSYAFPGGRVVHALCDNNTWHTDGPAVGAGGAPGEASGGAPAEGGAFPEAGAPAQAGSPGDAGSPG